MFAGLSGAQAGPFDLFSPTAYTLENRPQVVFPGPRPHISLYPMSKRSASIWNSDFFWRECSGQSGWHYQSCRRTGGPEDCRQALDANNRFCLRTCRTRGGPMVNLAD